MKPCMGWRAMGVPRFFRRRLAWLRPGMRTWCNEAPSRSAMRRVPNITRRCVAKVTPIGTRVSHSGLPMSTSSVILGGGVGRRPGVRTPFLPASSARHSSVVCRAMTPDTSKPPPARSITPSIADPKRNATTSTQLSRGATSTIRICLLSANSSPKPKSKR
ncbi:MAG: hypothetical protein BWY63_03710 [Chloroflexi bacterium ADurb.Bin360]|nr:MAG: hypothetical protein BWY63_03710 [Chloroflexi bacterium ADurb.Bin360]